MEDEQLARKMFFTKHGPSVDKIIVKENKRRADQNIEPLDSDDMNYIAEEVYQWCKKGKVISDYVPPKPKEELKTAPPLPIKKQQTMTNPQFPDSISFKIQKGENGFMLVNDTDKKFHIFRNRSELSKILINILGDSNENHGSKSEADDGLSQAKPAPDGNAGTVG